MKQLPIVAYSAFCRDFPSLNRWERKWYYLQQCAMKSMFDVKATIKFIYDGTN